jgi:hypothetical protein
MYAKYEYLKIIDTRPRLHTNTSKRAYTYSCTIVHVNVCIYTYILHLAKFRFVSQNFLKKFRRNESKHTLAKRKFGEILRNCVPRRYKIIRFRGNHICMRLPIVKGTVSRDFLFLFFILYFSKLNQYFYLDADSFKFCMLIISVLKLDVNVFVTSSK